MVKAAFVIPWYGEDIPGGAEAICRRTAENLVRRGVEVEVLTTCAKDFYNWANYYREGVYEVNGVKTRRFKVNPRNVELFDQINYKLMQRQTVTIKEEHQFIKEMINSENLYKFITNNKSKYYFFFIPYMFGTTYWGSKICPQRSFIIPCLHAESYAYMKIYKEILEEVKGVIFHSQAELDLAKRLYGLNKTTSLLLGGGVDTEIEGDKTRFRRKFGIKENFLLYAGRKDAGKNTPLLLNYFCQYKERNKNNLKLVLIGSGNIEIPPKYKDDVLDLGYVIPQDKYDAYAATTFTCQPSTNESFSLVVMESWLCGAPVLVHGDCEVTKEHCLKSSGGLYFKNYYEFEECVNFFFENRRIRKKMAQNGRQYVLRNYYWDKIVEKYKKLLKE